MVLYYRDYEHLVKNSIFRYFDSFDDVVSLLDYYEISHPSILCNWREKDISDIHDALRYYVYWDDGLTKQIKEDVAEYFGRDYLDDEAKYFSEDERDSLCRAIWEVPLTRDTKQRFINNRNYAIMFTLVISSFNNKKAEFLEEYSNNHNWWEQIIEAVGENHDIDIESTEEDYDEGFGELEESTKKHKRRLYY